MYDFLCEAGVQFIQFIPVVERQAGTWEAKAGLSLHGPGSESAAEGVTEWSVRPRAYGEFLTAVFERWIQRDVGTVFVMNIEWAFANFVGVPGAVCHHQPTCGRSVVVEHNGDVYACDHYVYPKYHLGNLHHHTFADMIDVPAQQQFGQDKYARLPLACKQCDVLKACWGVSQTSLYARK